MSSCSSAVLAPRLPLTESALQPWFGVRVRSQCEQMASTAIRGRDIEEFLPLVRVRRQWSDRVKELDVPLFPGYVFCRFSPSQRGPLMSCPGVVGVVSFNGFSAPIPDEEIQSVRALVESS